MVYYCISIFLAQHFDNCKSGINNVSCKSPCSFLIMHIGKRNVLKWRPKTYKCRLYLYFDRKIIIEDEKQVENGSTRVASRGGKRSDSVVRLSARVAESSL